MAQFDAIVVGASIAGATTAALLGRQGYQVLLLDKSIFPRAKVCGEGLMPAGVNILTRLGLFSDIQRAGAHPFEGIRFCPADGDPLELNFTQVSEAARGWILPRIKLDALLNNWAGQQPGVTFQSGVHVRTIRIRQDEVEVRSNGERFTARILIGADGIRSRFHRLFGLSRKLPRLKRFGLRTYYDQVQNCESTVEVHFSEVGEAYVAPMGGGMALVALLLYLRTKRRESSREIFTNNLERFPRLLARVGYSGPAVIEAAAPLALTLAKSHAHRLLLVGDAAGAIDPVTGQGMTMALKDAELASQLLDHKLRTDALDEAQLSAYTRERNRYFRPSYEIAEFILSTFAHAASAKRVVRALSHNHRLQHKIVSIAADLMPVTRLSLRDRLALLTGF